MFEVVSVMVNWLCYFRGGGGQGNNFSERDFNWFGGVEMLSEVIETFREGLGLFPWC